MKLKYIKNENIAIAGFNNVTIGFFSKILAYLSFMLIAYIFGTQIKTDVFYLAYSFITVIAGLFTVIFTSVFPPIFIRLKNKESIDSAVKFANSVMSWVIIFSLFFSIILYFFPITIYSKVSKFDISIIEGNKRLLTYFSFILFFTISVEYFRVLIQSLGLFTMTAIIALVQSVIMILCVLTLSGVLNIESMAVGLLLSLIIQNILLFIFCFRQKIGLKFTFHFDKNIKEIMKVGAPIWAAHIITIISGYFSYYIASDLKSGILTSVNYAQRLYILPVLIIFNPLLEVINTKFSEYYINDKKELIQKYVSITKLLFYLLTPIAIFIFFFKTEIVKILLYRGAFTMEDVNVTAICLGIFSFTIVTNCYLQISARIMFTLQKTGWTSLFGTIGHLLTIVSMYLFVQRLNYQGIPLGRLIVELLYFLPYVSVFMYYYLDRLSLKTIFYPLLKYIACSAPIIYSIKLIFELITKKLFPSFTTGTINLLLFLSLATVLCFGLYYFICKIFKIEEINILKKILATQPIARKLFKGLRANGSGL